ncbi:MAG: DUF3179 domain-containing protein [Saprospiraceae bacterium]
MSTIRLFTLLLMLSIFSFSNTSILKAQGNIEAYCAYNGFELENLEIPLTAIFQAGPGKEGVPSIENPHFLSAEKTDYLKDNDMVIGVSVNGIAKAYPVKIMNYHEIINDRFGEDNIAVTYSPLCANAMAFSTTFDGKKQTFGVSGLLYNNNLLFYDWETESLWSQMMGQAVTGAASGKKLSQIPVEHTTWAAWKTRHPETKVLSANTGYDRNYDLDPYALYGEKTKKTMFPVEFRDKKLSLKEKVVGVKIGREYRAYPMALLPNASKTPISDKLNGVEIQISYDALTKTAQVNDLDGRIIPTVTTYWYAWFAFHPETDIYGFLPEQYNLAMEFLSGGR